MNLRQYYKCFVDECCTISYVCYYPDTLTSTLLLAVFTFNVSGFDWDGHVINSSNPWAERDSCDEYL